MDGEELILKPGVEGGGASLLRTPVVPEGWRFHVEGSSMFLDENDGEDWRSWTGEPFPTIRDARLSIAEDGSWGFFYPVSIHPEYRRVVWELVQGNARRLPAKHFDRSEDRYRQWQRLCVDAQRA